MAFFERLLGPKDPEEQAKRLLINLSASSPDVVDLEAAIDSFDRQNPIQGAPGNAAGIIGASTVALQPLRKLQNRLRYANKKRRMVELKLR